VLRALGGIEGCRARQERRLVEDHAVRPPDPEGVLEVWSDSDVPGGEAAGDIQKEAHADMDKSAIRE